MYICCFSTNITAFTVDLGVKANTGQTQSHDNVSEWNYMTHCGLLFQWPSTTVHVYKSSNVGLVQGRHHYCCHHHEEVACSLHDDSDVKLLTWCLATNTLLTYSFRTCSTVFVQI